MGRFLQCSGVLLKNFGDYVENVSKLLKQTVYENVETLNRPIEYLQSSRGSKDEIARRIAATDDISEGLICLLKSVEPCLSYDIFINKHTHRLELVMRNRKCLHLYYYLFDPQFGFMHVRLQTWFPFNIQVYINGREWLGRQLDRLGISYEKVNNCFLWIEDLEQAQREMNRLVNYFWIPWLDKLAREINPAHPRIFSHCPMKYYWMISQSEWATDVMFKTTEYLQTIYPGLCRAGLLSFSSDDIMRFLGKKLNGNFKGEVVTKYNKRPEGIRVKHSVNGNSLKIYDKESRLIRVETTMNNPYEFKVYRTIDGGGNEKLPKWYPLRKSIADTQRRVQLSQAANNRYLEALATVDTSVPLKDAIDPVCGRVIFGKQKIRALQPWAPEDRALLMAVSRGEFYINGFRNRDLFEILFPDKVHSTKKEKSRTSNRITRLLRMLRAHGIIRKIPRTHRYLLTKKGQQITTFVNQSQHITMQQINDLAA